MINIKKINNSIPYEIFVSKYKEAINANQRNIEAVSISSYCNKSHEISSRYVNLKFIMNDEFIFFSNYNSPKALSFKSHNQIAALVYWASINVQIRMKAKIKKTSNDFNQEYFFNRSLEKNALAISSNQSTPIDSYNQVKENYNESLKNDDLKKCPRYWGGYSFKPYEIEFWEGNEYRLNKRNLYRKDNTTWNHFILEP
jgi:pyridoxamine 5'-phosphate oxidase